MAGSLASSMDPPPGLDPSDLQTAYNLPSLSAGAGQTVAIVDAYDQPNAESDLAAYRQLYGLPPINDWSTGSQSAPWFRKVDESGGTSYPATDTGWGLEISLDIEMVSAICPDCNILLVEANSASMSDLGTAVDEAVALGATEVSNSYVGGESVFERFFYDAYYDHPGVAITAGSGDSGYGTGYPAASQYVTAVGGTTLTPDTNTARGWTETAWSGAGSGCSSYEAKPAWQTDSGCRDRTIADVSAVASIDSPVAVYDSSGYAGWLQVYGTSVATPIIASVYALAGTPAAGTNPASYPYADPAGLNDVTSGSNGTCSPAYLCTAGPGFDGPTGLGTPNGVAAFTSSSPTTGTLQGTVTDASSGLPISGATVSVSSGPSTTTDSSGAYTLSLAAGTYSVTAAASGYTSLTQSASVTNGATTTLDFGLTSSSPTTGTLQGTVTDASSGQVISGATVSVSGGASTTTDATGAYTLSLAAGTYSVTAAASGYTSLTQSASVTNGATTTLDFGLTSSATGGFTLSASPSTRSIKRGKSTSYSITIARTGGFTGSVSFSLNGQPPGVTGSFSPSSTSGTSTVLSIGTTTAATAGSYSLTITGTDSTGSMTETVNVTLKLR